MLLKVIILNIVLVAFYSILATAVPTGDHDMRCFHLISLSQGANIANSHRSGSPIQLDFAVRSTAETFSLKRSDPGGISNFPANLAFFPGEYLGNIVNPGAVLEVNRHTDHLLDVGTS
jgi:hypothetical protein